MRLVSFSPKPAQFSTVRSPTFVSSDMAFGTHYPCQANQPCEGSHTHRIAPTAFAQR